MNQELFAVVGRIFVHVAYNALFQYITVHYLASVCVNEYPYQQSEGSTPPVSYTYARY